MKRASRDETETRFALFRGKGANSDLKGQVIPPA